MGLPILNWKKMLTSLGFRLRQSQGNSRQTRQTVFSHTHHIETLEPRQLLDGGGLDFADAPASYPVTLAEDGARHGIGTRDWIQLGSDIDGEALGDSSGHGVSLSSDGLTVAIGAGNNDENGQSSGHVQIYTWSGGAWNQLGADIDGEAAYDKSGIGLALSSDGRTVAIGAFGNDDNGSSSGHTRIFQWDGQSWNQVGVDIDGEAAGDWSGYAVSISGDGLTVAIGARNNGGNGSESGHTRVYRWDGTAWGQLGIDLDGEAADDESGETVALSDDGNTVVIGAPYNDDNGSSSGHARIYRWDGASWNQLGSDLDGEFAGDYSGCSVSISSDGNTVAIGAEENDGNGSSAGHVRIFTWDVALWSQVGADIDGEAAYDKSGGAVSLSSDGSRVAITAPYNDGNGSLSGHTRIYEWNGLSWNQLGSDLDGEVAEDRSGYSVSISGDGGTVAIGSSNNDGNGNLSGHTRIYRLDSLRLGESKDEEADGTHSAAADADGADEDGIVVGNLYAGSTGSLDVTVSGNAGLLDGWFDFNADGDWDDTGEQIFTSTAVGVGQTSLSVDVPADAAIGTTFARFRLSFSGGLGVVGEAADGEVEDYAVTIASGDSAPVIADPGNQSDSEGNVISLQISVTAPDVGALTWDAGGLPTDLSLDTDTGLITGTLSYESAGSYNVQISATDGALFDTTSFTWTIEHTNRAPVATDNSYSIAYGGALTVTASGILADDTDADGDSLTAELVNGTSHGTLSFGVDGSFSYTPDNGYIGSDSFTYMASDGENTSNVATVTITVEDPPHISIEAMQQGSEADGSATIFTLTRTGNTSASLEANVILQGTAQPGVDYTAPVGLGNNNTLTVTFDAGSDTASLSLPTLSDSVIDSYESVLAILQPGVGYSVQPVVDRAMGVIVGDDVEVSPEHFVAFDLSASDSLRALSNGVFAMLRSDGSIATWGDSSAAEYDALTANTPAGSGFTQIYSNNYAFAALHADGSLATWGRSDAGGDPGTFTAALEADIVHVIPKHDGFTAIKADGGVIAWGDTDFWGGGYVPPAQIDNIVKMCSTSRAFAALTGDGTIETWGVAAYGGGEHYFSSPPPGDGFIDVVAGFHHFAALHEEGTIVVWGGTEQSPWADAKLNAPTDDGYIQVVANGYLSFAALKADGSTTIWGIVNESPPGDGYTQIIPGRESFAALHSDGSIYSSLNGTPSGNDFTRVIANAEAYAAIKADGTVVTWGNDATGGDSASVTENLVDVVEIAQTQHAFAALRVDGTVITWGDADYGGDSSAVASSLTDVTHLSAIENAFTARRTDGSVVSWGTSGYLTGIPSETGLLAHATSKWNDRLTFNSFLSLSTNEISEGAGAAAATGTVTRSGDLSGELVVSLESSDTSEATVPATVTIADGQTSATFAIDAVNDSIPDLSQPAYIIASVAGQYYGRVMLEVVDDGDGALFIDDGDAGYSTNVSPITIANQGYQNDYQWILGTTPDSPYYIEYEASDIGAGNYEIATTWQTESEVGSFPRHSAVQYEIYDGQTLVDTVTVNQQQAPAADYSAGGENFEIIAPDVSISSDTLRVRILIQSPGTGASNYRTLSADAVRFSIVPEEPNTAPVFTDQALNVAENSVDGTAIGALVATDADGDALTYSISANVDPDGDGNGAFRIEGDQLLVNDTDDFDYEANTQLVITAKVSDGSLNDTAQITVNVTNFDEIPVINLVGDASLTVPRSDTASYTDAGATALDAEDGDITGSIVVSGDTVDLSTQGTYLIQFDAQDSTGNDADAVTRTVIVKDMTTPVIALNGSDTETVESGFPYTDPGATASDSFDGDLSGSIVVSGTLDPATPGVYTLTYNVQDAAGNSADPISRTVTVQDTLRPVIALTYSGEVLQVSDHADTGIGGEANAPSGVPTETSLGVVGNAGRLATPIIRSTDFTQPDGSPVESRQEWSGVASAGAVSEIPVAAAFDHVDVLTPTSSFILIDQDGTSQETTVEAIDWDTRSTYLFQYDAADSSGNYAEQVVFSLILNDTVAPAINVTGGANELVEAASDWTLAEATASDNIDGDLTTSILYSVENISTSTTLGTDLTYAEAAALLDTSQVGNYLVTMQVSDAAGIYGNSNTNNTATAQKAISIQDTLRPVITLTGDAVVNVNVDPGGTYSDSGATASDVLDGDLSGNVVLSGDLVNLKQAGSYTLRYNVSDAAGNAADTVTRTIHVGDPLVPGSGIFSGSIGIPTTDPASAAALDLLAVDLDQDGDQDLITLNSYSYGVTWYENDGAEVFTSHVLDGNYAIDQVIAADFDADGHLDIVAVDTYGGSSPPWAAGLELYPGDAATSFDADRILLSSGSYQAASADDFDGDGDTDIVTDKSWFENMGGSFTFTEHTYTTDVSYRVYPVDLDQDGDIDIVADGVWYENDGSQNLTPHVTLAGGHSQPIDLDGDGDIDIVSSDETMTDDGRQTSIYLLENDGAENFTSTQIVLSIRSTTMWDFRGPSLEVIDLDRDGDLDIPYADHGRVGVLMNDGQQSFTDQVLYASSEWYMTRTSDLAVVDVDGDGDLDIFSGTDERNWNPNADDRVDWYEQNARPTLDHITDLTINTSQSVALTGIGAGGLESQSLQVTAVSSDTNILPDPAVSYTAGTTGSLLLEPYGGPTGPVTITVTVTDGGLDGDLATAADNGTFSRSFVVDVTWVNEGPIDVSLTNTVTSLPENSDTSTAVKVADILITDEGHPESANTTSLTGSDATSFEVVGTELFLVAGTALDYESQDSYSVTVSVEDTTVANSVPVTAELSLAITNANEEPTFNDQSFTVAEITAEGSLVGALWATDPEGDAITYAITSNIDPDGDGTDAFRVEGDQLLVNDVDDFDYEANLQLVITASASDGILADTAQITINLTDLGEGSISGSKWNDIDGNQLWDTSELALSGWTIYIDANENGEFDFGEVSTVTDANGEYSLTGLIPGTYVIGEVFQAGWQQTYPHFVTPTSPATANEGTAAAPSPPPSSSGFSTDAAFVADQVIVKFKESAARGNLSGLRTLQSAHNAATLSTTRSLGMELWEINGSVEQAIATWSDDPRIEYIQPNYTFTIDTTVPNDPSLSQLWGLSNTGQTGGTADADIDAPEAWGIQTGTDILIGVIDTGIDYTHPDLVENIWTNPGEIAGNGIDDDGNGYVDDVHGYDFAYDDSDPMDVHSHGTHVAGTIAGKGNNGSGIVGVNWDAQLMALKFLDDYGYGSTYNAVLAVEYATMMGARITNNSWGGGGYDSALYDAIAAAGVANSLFVAAAGNASSNNDSSAKYPASYDLDNIITVASTNHNDALSYFSNYGATTVDLAAPGSDIYSSVPGGGYDTYSGTSMAAPHVAGVAALILAENPNLTVADVKQIILDSTDPIAALDGITVSGGRLNAFAALSMTGIPGTHSIEIDWDQNVTDVNFGNRINYPPVIEDQTFSIAENSDSGTLVGSLTATDQNGDALTYSIISNVDPDSDGTDAFRLDGNQLLVNDAGDIDYENLAQLQITAAAFDGTTADTAVITIDITNVIELPVVADDTYYVMIDDSLTVDAPGLLENDTVTETETLTTIFLDDVQHGTLQGNADGSFTYQPDPGFEGTDTFTYRANDGINDSSNVATVTLVVSGLLHTLDNPADNITPYGSFGNAVAVDGNYVLVGADQNKIAGSSFYNGEAYLFDKTTGNLLHSFSPPEGADAVFDDYGYSVDIDGNLIVIGAPDIQRHSDPEYSDYSGPGTVYLYDAVTGDLLQTIEDPTPSQDGQFGKSVAIDNNQILIGNPRDDTNGINSGQAYLFDATSGGLVAILDDPTPGLSDEFGEAVAIDDGRILVSAIYDDTHGYNSGQVHLFNADTGNLLHTLENPYPEIHRNFGKNSLAIDENHILVGHSDASSGGRAHQFDASTGELVRTFMSEHYGGVNRFGWSVAIDENIFVIGIDRDDTQGSNVGRVQLFNALSGDLIRTIDDPTITATDGFGYAVAIDGEYVVIGAAGDGTLDTDVGQAHIYHYDFGQPPPFFDDQTFSLAENSASGTVVGSLTASHPDGNNLIYSIAANVDPDGDAEDAFRVEGDQLLVNDAGDIDYENLAQMQITAAAFDGTHADTAVITIDITNMIEPPLASDDIYNVAANDSLTVNAPGVLSNDTVLDTETLNAVLVDDVQHGTLQFNADGSFTYQPDQHYYGDDTFTYRVNDGITDSADIATVNLAVSSLLHTLDNPNTLQGENFGFSVATDGNLVLVGAPDNGLGEGYTDGQAYLYDAATGDLLQSFDPPEGATNSWERFGTSVAVDGNLVLIGDTEEDVNDTSSAGQAYLYDATTGDLIRIIDDPALTHNGGFASAMAIDSNHILIGNSNHFITNDYGRNEPIGQAYLFDASTGDLLHTLDDPTRTYGDNFGGTVAIDGDRILIGASGHSSYYGEVHLFDTNTGSLLHTFDNPTPSVRDYFGNSVAIDGNHILIGAHEDSAQGADVGQAYLYDATSYDLIRTFNDPTVTSGDEFGISVAMQDNIILIGAWKDDTKGTDVGQAHVFDALSGDLLQTLNDPTVSTGDNFGRAVAAAGDYFVIGAYRHHIGSNADIGQAHIFTNNFGAHPVFTDQTFSVAENSTDGTLVGTLVATDADGDSLTYSIATNVDPDGDGNDAFRREGDQLVVNDADDFDFETNLQLVITAEASDGSLSDTAQITVNVTDVDEIPVITLLGDSPLAVEASNTGDYSDPGATATDPEEGDISGSVAISGQVVNLSVPGTYLIDYDVADSAGNDAETITRSVLVQDTLPPVITLTGDAIVNVTVDPSGTYSDAGATAVDSLDGDLTGSVVVGGDVVDLSQEGNYTLTYNVSDNAGNAAEPVTRTVNVLSSLVDEFIILDDGEAGFVENGFTEQSDAQVAAAYDGDVHHMQGGSGEASWTFTGLPADHYQVAATWAYKYNNNYNATDAPFTLSDAAGGVFSTQIVNQKLTPSEFEDAGYYWDTLDTVEVTGGTLVVTLGAGSLSNNWVVADAIRVSVAPTLTVAIADAAVVESAGAAATTATVTRNGSTDADLVVSLASGDATEVLVPATVTIPAGQASTAFSIDAVDDSFFDGTQSVSVLATAIGFSDGSDSLEILDDDSAYTALIDDGEAGFAQSGFTYQSNSQVAAAYNGDNYSLRYGDDADQASWTFTGLDDGAYRVMATWAHKYDNNYNATDAPFELLDAGSNVLSSVAINQNNAPSQFEVGGYFWDTLDTVYVAGGQLTVTLGASAQANLFVVADAVRIEQFVQSTPTLVVQLFDEIVDEDAGTVSGIVSRGAETVGDLVVSLSSDDSGVGTVPATVTIPDGTGSAVFTISVVDDAVVDGDQQVAVTATAAGYIGGTDSLLVEDDEFPTVQVIDNGDAGFTETGGFKLKTWATAYEGDNHYMRGSDGEARWQFTDLIDGEYTVSVTWDHIYENRYNTDKAPFTIRNAADQQLLAVSVDQKLSPASFNDGVTDWHTLGTMYVIDGQLTVSLTETLVNEYVVADAVRIEIDTDPDSKLLVILDASSVSETGTLNGKVIRTGDTSGSLTVNLASDNTDAATVPASVVIADGARYGTFAITPTDDSALDGTQVAGIAATAEGFTAGVAALDVTDDDATVLFIDDREDGFVADAGFKRRNVPGAYGNNNHSMRGGTGEASWTFTGLAEGQYFVSATWNHIYENRYNTDKAPFSITNGSGNLLTSLTVDQTLSPDDFTDGGHGWKDLTPVYINDGTLIVTLGAAPTNLHAVADAIRIELNESLAPSLFVLVDSESESAGSATGTVVRTGDTGSEAVVSLTSSNPNAATVESSITFAIGESTKSFTITPIDDSSPNGIQQSTIEATATGYAAGTAVLNVEDDDALSVAIMDNTDSGYTSNGFRDNNLLSEAYGGNNQSLKGGEPGEEASWTFTGLTDGVYHVSATWNHQYDNKYTATDAQYSITNAADEAIGSAVINQTNAPSEFLDNGIAWGTLDTVTVTGGELVVTVSGGSDPNRHTVADAVRIARVAQLGGSSMRMAEADPFYDPLEDAIDDLAGAWGETEAGEADDHLTWID